MTRYPMLALAAFALSTLACANPGGAGDPSSVAISTITYDAVFIVNGGSNSLSVVDAAMSRVAATVQLKDAMYPHHISLSADRSRLLVAVPGMDLSGGHGGENGAGPQGAVLLLDARTGATLAARKVDMSNHNAIFSPDGKEVWTSQMMMSGSVLVLDATTLATRQTIPVGDMPAEITFSRDGKYAFVANGMSDNVSVIDVATKAVKTTVAVGKDPVGAWPGGDGVMYVDNEVGKSLTAIDAGTLMVVRTYDLGFTPAVAATAPGGELWVTDTDNGKVVFYAAGTTTKVGELATGAGAHAIAFSADGATAYVTNQKADSLSVIDVKTRAMVKTIPTGSMPNGLLFRAK